MTELIQPYKVTVLITGLSAVLFLAQLLIADLIAIKSGHTPGYPIDADHEQLLFRANRAIANSNESVGIFLLAVSFSILTSANAAWVNTGALLYFGGRVGHMVCYYANIKLVRSIAFGVCVLGLSGILVAGFSSFF